MNKIFRCFIANLLAFTLMASAVINSGPFTPAMAEENDRVSAAGPVKALSSYELSQTERAADEFGFIPVLTNAEYTLLYKADTAETAVYNRTDDVLVFSNPQDMSTENEGLAYHRMKSQLYLSYYVNNSQVKYFSSYYDSVKYGQYTASIADNVLAVNYVFGKMSYSKEMLPVAIPKKKFEKEVLPGLSEEDRAIVKKRYKAISINDTMTEATRRKYIDQYANIKDTDLYILDKYLPSYEVEKLYKALYSNYTQKDSEEDNKAAGANAEVIDTTVSFTLSLIYELTDDGLSVSLDCSKLSASQSADIDSVSILEFFGCGGTGDIGYSLVPDGSGGIIRFNTKKEWAAPYSGMIYGQDRAVKWRHSSVLQGLTHIQLPVFGISKNETGIFAVVEKGGEVCSIQADIADSAIPYNRASISANVNPYDKMSILNPDYGGGSVEILVRPNQPFKGRVTIHYYFLGKGKNTYAEMATLYRGVLLEKGVLGEKLTGDIPFVFGLLGAVDVKKQFLGIPYTGYRTLTTFEQARNIISAFEGEGMNTFEMRYLGWFNNGLRQTDISKATVLSCLGGKKGFEELVKSTSTNIYPDVKVAEVSGKLFDGFSVRKDAARLIYNETALLYPLSLSQNTFDYTKKHSYLLSTGRFEARIGKFLKKYLYKHISLSDLANQLNSDFAEANYTDRTAAKKIVTDALSSVSQQCRVMASAPNSYAFGNISVMTDMPVSTSGANLIDTAVPFIQLVLGGYVDMACEPINISDGKYDLLTLMAFCTLPNYTLIYEPSSALKDTHYSQLYSLHYKDWFDKAVTLYKDYVRDMQKVRGQTVSSYEITDDGLVKIVHENGVIFLINRTDHTLYAGEYAVEAQTYRVFEQGDWNEKKG